jgi:hypothetical protein
METKRNATECSAHKGTGRSIQVATTRAQWTSAGVMVLEAKAAFSGAESSVHHLTFNSANFHQFGNTSANLHVRFRLRSRLQQSLRHKQQKAHDSQDRGPSGNSFFRNAKSRVILP